MGKSSKSVLQKYLSRYGAGGQIETAEIIVEKISATIAVSEAIHGPIYQKLLTGLV